MGGDVGLEDERLAHLRIEDGIEAGREVGDGRLGDLADLAELTVGLGTAVQGVLGSEGGEVRALLELIQEAVSQMLALDWNIMWRTVTVSGMVAVAMIRPAYRVLFALITGEVPSLFSDTKVSRSALNARCP